MDDRNDQSVTTSIAALYKAAANPMRTNVNNIGKSSSPFVSSQTSRIEEGDEEDNCSAYSHQSVASQHSSARSERSTQSADERIRSYVSRRSRDATTRAEEIRNDPFVKQHRQQEKTVFLHELNRMKMAGSVPTRNFTDEDDIADIQFECNRIKNNEDQVSTVSFMKDFIKLGATGLELMNNKFNLLRLSGWSGEVTRDMERYNRPLSKIYQRYWRKGSVSPFLELGFLLFGSLIVHHFKNLLMGGSSTPSVPPPAPVYNAPSRNVPFNIPQQQSATPPPTAGNAPARKTMRRPKRAESMMQQQPPPPPTATNQPPPNLIDMILQQQAAQATPPGGNMMPAPGGNGNRMPAPPGGVSMTSIPIPNMQGGVPMMGGVIMVDMQHRQRNNQKNTTELEIVEEKEEKPSEHRIDIHDDGNEDGSETSHLSFDM